MVNQQSAITLCCKLYEILSKFGYYPALTGGQLYKQGNRKDIDIVIYRNRQEVAPFEMVDVERELEMAGLSDFKYFCFVTKAKWNGLSVDLFNPETSDLDSNY